MKDHHWRTPDVINKDVGKAKKSVSNWVFLLTGQIAIYAMIIIFKTMKSSEKAETGGKSNIPSLFELTEGKKVDTGKLADSLVESAKENIVPSYLLETISNIPQSTISTATTVFVVTGIILILKILRRKKFEAELEAKYSEIKKGMNQ